MHHICCFFNGADGTHGQKLDFLMNECNCFFLFLFLHNLLILINSLFAACTILVLGSESPTGEIQNTQR